MGKISLFSNHGNVLLVLSEDPDARLRDVALRIEITERAVQKIVRDLQEEGVLTVTKLGRRNSYRINTRKVLDVPLSEQCTVGTWLSAVRGSRKTSKDKQPPVPARAPQAPIESPPETLETVDESEMSSPEQIKDSRPASKETEPLIARNGVHEPAEPLVERPIGEDVEPESPTPVKKKRTSPASSPARSAARKKAAKKKSVSTDEHQGDLF